jgi:catechol 2,3-dioxygenase-like lactoylglutathione lyase family enzyme
MAADLNHIIVHATEPRASAEFLAAVLDLPVRPAWGPFVPVRADNGVTLDFLHDRGPFTEQHCAFLVSDEAFDAGLRRLRDLRACIWADPRRRIPDAINHHYGGRGLYFDDPDGHLMELITTPYGETPAE